MRAAAARGPGAAFLVALLLVAANLRPSLTGVGPLLEQVRSALGLSATEAGLLGSLPLVMFAVCAPLARLGTRLGMERVVAAGLVALVVGILLRSAGGVPSLYAGTTLLAAAIATINVLVPSIVKDRYPDRLPLLTTVYATVMGAVAGVASGVAVPLAAVLPGQWRGSLAVWTLPAVLALAVWLPQALRAPPVKGAARRAADDEGRGPPHLAAAVSAWRAPVAWQVLGHMGMQATMFYTAIAWYPAYLADRGYTPTEAGWLLTLYQIAAFAAGLAIPTLLRRLPDQRGLAFGLAAAGFAATVGLWLLPQASLLWMVLLGVGAGPSLILSLSFMGLRAGNAAMAAQLSMMAQAGGYGLAAAGPLVFGILHDGTGGWSLPLAFVMTLAALKALFGLGAGRRVTIG
jgi:MFS transporter, CP family, cyanate transporter